MTHEGRPRANSDPAELWRQWYDATFGAWSETLSDGEAYLDPLGLYRQWSSGLQEGVRRPREGTPFAGEFWEQWFAATTDLWRRYTEYGSLLVGFWPQWVEMNQEVTRQMFEGGRLPADPLDFYTRLYNATNGPLSKMIRELLQNETFLADSRRLMENYSTLETVLQGASERYLGDNLRLSTRSDNTRLARLVVGLEGKLDRLEEAFEDFEDGHARPATAETVGALEGRIEGLEQMLEESRSDLARVEEKLDRLLQTLDTAASDGQKGEG